MPIGHLKLWFTLTICMVAAAFLQSTKFCRHIQFLNSMNSIMKLGFLAVLAVSSTTLFAQSQKMYAYKIDPLGGTLTPRAINDSGQIVGGWIAPQNVRGAGFVTGARGKGNITIELGDRIVNSYAVGINNQGVVIGNYSEPKIGFLRPFIYSADQGARPLFGTSATFGAVVSGINNMNQVAGFTYNYPPGPDRFLFRPFVANFDGAIVSRLSGLPESFTPSAINDVGQVTGTAYFADSSTAPFVTGHNGRGAKRIGTDDGQAYSINNSGEVAGYFYINGEDAAFSTRHGTHTINSRESDGATYSIAVAIGAGGTIGGRYDPHDQTSRGGLAFVAKPKGPLLNLNRMVVNKPTPYMEFTTVYAINASMQAAVAGDDGNAYIVCPTVDCL